MKLLIVNKVYERGLVVSIRQAIRKSFLPPPSQGSGMMPQPKGWGKETRLGTASYAIAPTLLEAAQKILLTPA